MTTMMMMSRIMEKTASLWWEALPAPGGPLINEASARVGGVG
jgi:hypothetical protein